MEEQEIIKEFLIESAENLSRLDQEMVELEQYPEDTKLLASIFRTIHTIKGTCGFFGFSKLESLSHAGENLLSLLRDKKLSITPEITNALLALVDSVRQMLAHIETYAKEDDVDYSAIVELLKHLQQPPQTLPKAEPIGGIMLQTIQVSNEDIILAAHKQTQGDLRRSEEILVEQEYVKPHEVVEALHTQNESRTQSVVDNNIRVDVGLLDKLMNLVGELVLARNQILQFTATQKDSTFIATSQRLNLITTELQEGVMKTRMQPIGNIWNKFPRVVRDISLMCGKQAYIEMEGKETELDKTIIESIKDPLTHIVRNAIDHGIEKPEDRINIGKPAEGRLFLRAFHEGGQVNIEISDDGAGINSEQIKQKALQRGLISPEQAARMTEREILNLIFLPGLSTAEKLTNVSGRGVGMDVVKTNIEKIGGIVDLQSKFGQGTTLKIKIPLTLAIIPALIVTSGGNRYSIPQVNLLELVRLEGENAHRGIERIHNTPIYRLRGNLLPLVYLNKELEIEHKSGNSDSTNNEITNIVVLKADDRQFGMVVDEINDTEEIVVKPLSKQLKGITSFAGATIMGDGKVALILDILGIAQRAGVISEVRERLVNSKSNKTEEELDNRETLLLFMVGKDRRMAIPLSMVARLEEFPCSLIEKACNQQVVQYRNQILPLIRLSDLLGSESIMNDPMQVVVYSEQGRSVGLIVEHIIDIVEEPLVVKRRAHQPGILGSTVVQQRVTDMLDVHGIIRAVDANFFEEPITEVRV